MTNPYAPPAAIVDDIIAPQDEMVLAERLTRLGAAILDGIIVMVAVYAPLTLVFFGTDAKGSYTDEDGQISPLVISGVLGALVGFAIWGWFTLQYVRRNGQSIAKKFLDIKVVRRDGSRATLSRIFWLRNVTLWLLSMIPVLGVVVGLIDALLIFTEARQCLHDKIADTIVINA